LYILIADAASKNVYERYFTRAGTERWGGAFIDVSHSSLFQIDIGQYS
jgi:hypothetical protein